MDLKLSLLIAVLLSAFGAAIITTDKLRDKRFKWYRSITPKGWIVLILYSLITGVSVLQYIINDNDAKEQERIQDTKDSINAAKIIDNNRKTASILSETLGKYGFALDSTNKKLVKLIQDSAKVKRIIEEIPPVFTFNIEDAIKYTGSKDSIDNFTVSFTSLDAGSTDFNCFLYFIYEDSLFNMIPCPLVHRISGDVEKISKDGYSSENLHLYNNGNKFSKIYFALIGSYKNLDKTKIYQVEDIIIYTKKNNRYGRLTNAYRQRVLNVINKLHKDKYQIYL